LILLIEEPDPDPDNPATTKPHQPKSCPGFSLPPGPRLNTFSSVQANLLAARRRFAVFSSSRFRSIANHIASAPIIALLFRHACSSSAFRFSRQLKEVMAHVV